MKTPASGMAAIKAILSEFETVDAYLKAVHEVMAEGHMPDIAALEKRVAHLCAAVQEVDASVQERCLAKLDDLLGKLNSCEEAMTAFHKTRTGGVS